MNEITELLKSSVNVHGHLHLDATKTAALIRWVSQAEKYIEDTTKGHTELMSLVTEAQKVE